MDDLELHVPAVAANATTNLWTPAGVEYIQSWVVGKSVPRVVKHEFRCTFMGRTKFFGVLAEEDCPESQIEDLAAGLFERTANEIFIREQVRGGKLRATDLEDPANIGIRRELAAVFRDFKKHAKRRRASTNNRLYYPGLH